MKYITIFHQFKNPRLGNREKTVRVYLPDDYEKTTTKYPVLYMHDGQNLTEPSPYSEYSWNVVDTILNLVKKGLINPIVIVGIDSDSTFRVEEYSNTFTPKFYEIYLKERQEEQIEPEAALYSEFIVKDIIPFIQNNYPVNPLEQGIAGSSCGGNIAYYMGLKYPQTFNLIGAFSPAFEVEKAGIYNLVRNATISPRMKVYHDMGMKEIKWFSLAFIMPLWKVNRLLKKKGIQKKNLKIVIDPQANHSELFWQARFYGFLTWAYKKEM